MKRYLNMALAIVILVGAFTASAHAQSGRTPRMIANIPFAFNAMGLAALKSSAERAQQQAVARSGKSSVVVIVAE